MFRRGDHENGSSWKRRRRMKMTGSLSTTSWNVPPTSPLRHRWRPERLKQFRETPAVQEVQVPHSTLRFWKSSLRPGPSRRPMSSQQPPTSELRRALRHVLTSEKFSVDTAPTKYAELLQSACFSMVAMVYF